ncbi:hypothetical protein DFH08DRAFT_976355 [Mycena albidolilacea]|uniref:Uncharacterized protein n=1 Tax=Mycena albidolilacea TaxID=1033008 RepID=A0AAD7E9R3_9AGAR|nr:hypothetical protein DFH08DRAFT_976355 [Mycena albidolilacea]
MSRNVRFASTADLITILNGMQAAGMKVLRPWVTGVGAGQRASNNIALRDLEANGIGNYDDTVLNWIDRFTYRYGHGLMLMAAKTSAQTHGVDGSHTNPGAALFTFSQNFILILSVNGSLAVINAFNERIIHI